ncbi:MAG: glycosyltransferase family 39 protein [Anaerolineae bacterium]
MLARKALRALKRWDWPLLAIVVVALALRLYGLAWDDGLLFHPDERQIFIQVDRLDLPRPLSLTEFFSPESPWNPQFFAYGSLPLYLLRGVTWLLGLIDPYLASVHGFYLSGRVVAALLDVGTLLLVYSIGWRLYGWAVGLLGAGLMALAVLHIQLAHFYTVDSMLAFLAMWTLYVALRALEGLSLARGAAMGAALGLALATKVSAAPLALPLGMAWLLGKAPAGSADSPRSSYRFGWRLAGLALTLASAAVVMVLAQPYTLIDPFRFVRDVIHEGRMASGALDVPYTRQYLATTPYLYHLRQLVLWSLGIPLGVTGLAGIGFQVASIGKAARSGDRLRAAGLGILLAWASVYVALVGGLHAKFARYMLPVTPLLCLWAANLISWGWMLRRGVWRFVGRLAAIVVVAGTVLYALAYMRVYAQEHPWLQATHYICQTVPSGSVLMLEHWDDPLPLTQRQEGADACYDELYLLRFPAYDKDSREKADTLIGMLQSADYVVLASNRLYDTIPRLPKRYPLTSRYYEALMGEELGFELVYYATAYPGLLGVELVDDTFSHVGLPVPALMEAREAARVAISLGPADESFTVYDHPKPLLFRRTQWLSRSELEAALGVANLELP